MTWFESLEADPNLPNFHSELLSDQRENPTWLPIINGNTANQGFPMVQPWFIAMVSQLNDNVTVWKARNAPELTKLCSELLSDDMKPTHYHDYRSNDNNPRPFNGSIMGSWQLLVNKMVMAWSEKPETHQNLPNYRSELLADDMKPTQYHNYRSNDNDPRPFNGSIMGSWQ